MRRCRVLVCPALLLTLAMFGAACSADNAANDDGSADDEGTGSSGVSSGDGDDWSDEGGDGDGDGDGGDDGAPKYDIGGGGTEGGDEDPNDDGNDDDDEMMDMGEPVCDEESPVTLYLSPDDSNSMSSPVQARAAVLDGGYDIYSTPIRPWEFFNYYGWDYPEAVPGELALTVEMFQPMDAPEGDYVLQIGVSSETVTDAQRAPMNLTLVLDESGSMSGTPMEMQKEACRAIAASLKAGDKVSMVTWDTNNAVHLAGYSVTGPDDAMLLQKINALQAGGGTDLHGGLTAGYDLAAQVYDKDRINRIVLVSDGGANAGVTDINLIAQHAEDNNGEGIYMVGVGVGTASSYKDQLMDEVTDAGKGASVFIPDEAEAWKAFHDDFVNTMDVAARDVQVRVDLPPGFKFITFSGEEMSEDPDEVEPQHIAPNDSMVFHQTISSCAPQLLDDTSEITVTATYKNAIDFTEAEVSRTFTFDELVALSSPQLHKGRAVFEYTQALKAHKKQEENATAAALALLDEADGFLPDDPDLAEIRSVLEAIE